MKFAVLGWNYRTTPVELREQLTASELHVPEFAQALRRQANLQELLVLSTCNRVEFYFVSPHPEEAGQCISRMIQDQLQSAQLEGLSYASYDLAAVQHLFRVTSSLDSMVLGEPQIQGQVKDAYQQFVSLDHVGPLLKGLFPRAFSTAKRVRTETQIAHFAVSISFAAVELAKRIFSDLSEQTVMIVGAGEMAELAAKHFLKSGVSKLLVCNRTFANAAKLAEEHQGAAIRFEQLPAYLGSADIIIGSTGAHKYIVTQDMVKQTLRKRKGNPLFFIDIAVPRDIDPQLNDLPNVYCYDIDDLQNVVDNNRRERELQAELAADIIQEEVKNVDSWFKTLSAVPSIRSLRETFHGVGSIELEKTLRKLEELSPDQKDHIKRMVHSIINKLLHTPTSNLRKVSSRDDAHLYLETLTQLFELSPLEVSVEENQKPTLTLVRKSS